MAGLSDFQYVEFASNGLTYFRNVVGHVKHLAWLQDRYSYTDCFSTYFLFDRTFMEYVNRNRQSVAGYNGPCYANFLPLDIDSPNLGQALGTAREITRYFLDRLGTPEEAILPYYSGQKGFHLCLSTDVFGDVSPGEQLPAVCREVRRSIVKEARVSHPETVDFSISDRLRLLRLPNTRHSKSGLYKIPLSTSEVLRCEPEEMRRLAREPRQVRLTDETGLIPRCRVDPVPRAVDLFARCTERAEQNSHSDLPDPATFLGRGDLDKALCRAEIDLYREGVPEGSRSSMCLRLASRMRAAGYARQEASDMVESFAERCRPPLDLRTAREIVNAAYKAQGKGYQFGCGNGEADAPHTRLVHERCPYPDRMGCKTFRGFRSRVNGYGEGSGRG
jgi:hypothetical protein